MTGLTLLCAGVVLTFCAQSGRADAIWVEGEAPSQSDWVRHDWYDRVDKSIMSGRDWLSHYHKQRPGLATYRFEVERAGRYTFWLRCNPFRVTMAYRLDAGAWTPIGFDELRGRVMISPKPDHRFLAWVRVGAVPLDAGEHTITFRLTSGIANHGGIDCFCFVDTPFVPAGTTQPGTTPPVGPATWFPVVMDDDPFAPDSVIDMSHLIPKPAGALGFVQRDGATLRLADADRPIKFWGVGANVKPQMSKARQRRRVRYLTKHGVNMVRQHPLFDHVGPLRGGRLDAQKMDAYDWWFAQLKAQGIYTTWSVFYPLKITPEDEYEPELFAELEDGRTYGVVNFSRPLQDLQRRYVKALLEHRNPYTGLAYKDDPALAVLEVHNEDCVFFHWPLNALAKGEMPRHAQLLRRMFCQWARERYLTDQALRRAWGTRETLSKGELALHGAWQLKGTKPDQRMGDFIRFLTEVQRDFYERRERAVRDLGFKGVTVTTAWRSGGPAAGAANLYCDTAMDMIDRHNYFGGGAGGHGIAVGKVNNATHLSQPGGGILAVGMYQVEDRPFAVSEWTQLPPNQWKAEIAPLFAFYGMGLQGWDASCHFTSDLSRIGDGWPNLRSYVTDTPHYMGQFPALTCATYQGHIAEGPIVAARRLRRQELFTGVDPLGQDFTGGGWDDKQLRGSLDTPRQALAIGRVTVGFDGGRSFRSDWDRYWDRPGGMVRATTGELEWDTARRIVRVTAAKTQALIGFAGGTTQDLPGATVQMQTAFVSLIFTGLDDRALIESREILITAMARDRQHGTRYNADGTQLEATGGPPLLMEPVQATITLKGPAIRLVRALDLYGMPTDVRLPVQANTFRIDGSYQTYYYQVQRD